MKAIMIVGNAVKAITIDPDNQLESLYNHIGCRMVTGAGYPDEHHAAWVDDEGLIGNEPMLSLTEVRWYPQPLAGIIVITGFDPNTGDTTDATMTVEEARQLITKHTFLLRPI